MNQMKVSMEKIINHNDQEGKTIFSSQPQLNPKGNDATYNFSSSGSKTYHGQVKVVTTLRRGRVIDIQIDLPPPKCMQVKMMKI